MRRRGFGLVAGEHTVRSRGYREMFVGAAQDAQKALERNDCPKALQFLTDAARFSEAARIHHLSSGGGMREVGEAEVLKTLRQRITTCFRSGRKTMRYR